MAGARRRPRGSWLADIGAGLVARVSVAVADLGLGGADRGARTAAARPLPIAVGGVNAAPRLRLPPKILGGFAPPQSLRYSLRNTWWVSKASIPRSAPSDPGSPKIAPRALRSDFSLIMGSPASSQKRLGPVPGAILA